MWEIALGILLALVILAALPYLIALGFIAVIAVTGVAVLLGFILVLDKIPQEWFLAIWAVYSIAMLAFVVRAVVLRRRTTAPSASVVG